MNNEEFLSRFTQETIKSADMCWSAFKAQLRTHNPNKQELEKLSKAMISFIKDLTIIK